MVSGILANPDLIRVVSPNALRHRNLQRVIRNKSSDSGSEQLGDDVERIRAPSAGNLLTGCPDERSVVGLADLLGGEQCVHVLHP